MDTVRSIAAACFIVASLVTSACSSAPDGSAQHPTVRIGDPGSRPRVGEVLDPVDGADGFGTHATPDGVTCECGNQPGPTTCDPKTGICTATVCPVLLCSYSDGTVFGSTDGTQCQGPCYPVTP
jgi:hypothetical protein